jgi:dCTP deaminase
MILAKSELRKAVRSGELQFLDDEGRTLPEWFEMCTGMLGLGDEVNPVALQPASVDLTLGDHWLVPKSNMGELKRQEFTDSSLPVEYDERTCNKFLIPAHGFVLARTREVVKISGKLTAFVEGRSSVGRLGLFVENAGWVDPGFHGSITMELYNALSVPILLHAGMRICQLVVSRMDGDTEGGYKSSKYQGQVQATGSKLYKDFQK